MKGLIVGRHSYLAQMFWRYLCRVSLHPWERCAHDAVPDDLWAYDWVVNFSYDPRMMHDPYDACHDADAWLAERIARLSPSTRLVMLSTRKVYPASASLHSWQEDDAYEAIAQGYYGRNKWLGERVCRSWLPEDRLLILRCGNLFGLEVGRPTFMGMAQSTLVTEGVVRLDTAGSVQRDFLPASHFCEQLVALLEHGITGTYNVGSGRALRLDVLCQALIDGYGQGNLETDPARQHDAFQLDTQRLLTYLPHLSIPTAEEIQAHARGLGAQLAMMEPPT